MKHDVYPCGRGASIIAPKLMSQFRDQKVKVVHAMPGRLRLQCDSWKNDIVAKALSNHVEKHPLILSSEASPITGSLTLKLACSSLLSSGRVRRINAVYRPNRFRCTSLY